MADSPDDDWFDRDIDDFVVDVTALRTLAGVDAAAAESPDVRPPPRIHYVDPNESGNYVQPSEAGSAADAHATNAKHSSARWNASRFAQLLEQHQHSPDALALEIGHDPSGFRATIDRSTVPRDVVRLAVRVAATIAQSSCMRQHVADLLHIVRTVKIFWRHIVTTLREMTRASAKGSAAKKKTTASKNRSPESAFVHDICQLLRCLAEYNDGVVGLAAAGVLDDLIEVVTGQPGLQAEFGDQLREAAQQSVATKPPSIYPQLAELQPDFVRPAIAANRVTGPYDSIGQYLDAQLAFLRDDFVHALRCQVTEFRARHRPEGGAAPVCIEVVPCPKRDQRPVVVFAVKVPADPPMFGNLLVFTSVLDGEMTDLVLAVVVHTDPDLEAAGYVQIEIVRIENMPNVLRTPLVLIESKLFFEPYHQVYLALSERRSGTLFPVHLQRQLIDAAPATSPAPAAVPIHPDALATCNANQAAAIQASLQQRLTLIHGPPGTGKSFVGLQIVQQLLRRPEPSPAVHPDPIVIVCATNQALDQFLDQVAKVTPLIVRLGNQSKSAQLDRFNVRQLHQSHALPLAHQLAKRMWEARDALNTARGQLIEELAVDGRAPRNVAALLADLQRRRRRVDELHQLADAEVMRGRRVVAMTSTKAAQCRTLLRLLGARVVIVEEAAEMLEAHIVAALTPAVEQLILIGDHKQLRPQTGSRHTAHDLHFDISLFERMLGNGLACSPLTVQHRMHPRIADLVRATQSYERLEDADTVLGRPACAHIDGRNVFFFDHPHEERSVGHSKSNPAEALLVRATCDRLLVAAGLPATDLAILTLYAGQASAIETSPGRYRGVRVAVLDNYQGREARVVLLSLVRSNADAHIGFVATENRVCVAMSRARDALYMFGNLTALAGGSRVWRRLRDHLQSVACVGTAPTVDGVRSDKR